MNRSLLRLAAPIIVIGALIGWCVRSSAVQPNAVQPAGVPSASASAPPTGPPIELLDGLAVGQTIGEFTVERIVVNQSPHNTPQLAIELARKGSGITVWVARKESEPNPPISTTRYSITHGHVRPDGEPLPSDAQTQMAEAIAARIRKNELTATPPAGL